VTNLPKTDVTPAILSHDFARNFIVRHRCSMQLCMSHTATLLHKYKQELTNQHSTHSHDENCTEYSTKRSCATVQELRDTKCHTCDFVAR